MKEEDFSSKEHLTKHLTGAQYDVIRERTRINSWPELDYISWKEWLAETWDTAHMTPFQLRLFVDASQKYRKAFGSFGFGLARKLGNKWVLLIVGGIVTLILILYFTGNLTIVGG